MASFRIRYKKGSRIKNFPKGLHPPCSPLPPPATICPTGKDFGGGRGVGGEGGFAHAGFVSPPSPRPPPPADALPARLHYSAGGGRGRPVNCVVHPPMSHTSVGGNTCS